MQRGTIRIQFVSRRLRGVYHNKPKEVVLMKKFFVMLALLAFAVSGSIAMAAEKKVNCCVNGKVQKVTKAKCASLKGSVVKSAKQCKPMKK
jgi:hypothetical protein